MNRYLYFFIAISVLIIFAGCSFGPNYTKPEVDIPEGYRTESPAADSLLNLKWWELFHDPILDTLVNTALQQNKNVLIAASRVEEARAALGFNKADLFPALDLQANASRGDLVSGIKLDQEKNNFFIAPVLNWELDFWGRYRRTTEASRAELMATRYGLRTVQIGLISEVVSTYFLLIDFQKRLEISRRTLQLREESLEIIRKRFERGIIPEIDLLQAKIQKEIAVQAIPAFQRQIARTENALSILLGQLPDSITFGTTINFIDTPPVIPTGLPSRLLERRPDIAEAEYRLMAQTARIGVAQALRLPAIRLTGLLGVASDDLSSLTTDGLGWSVSGSLFGPIFNFNQNVRRVESEEERARQALLAYENTVLTAFREVQDALIDIQTYRQQTESKLKEYEAALQAVKLSQSRYDKGVTSYLEVLDSDRTLFNVELQYSEIRQQYYNTYVQLYKALGGGWITPREMHESEP